MEIVLTNGQVAHIDEQDYSLVLGYTWQARKRNNTTYAKAALPRNGEKQKEVMLHRLIMGAQPGEVIDHRNHNGLINTRENLRRCTQAQNAQNRLPNQGFHYKGVYRNLNTGSDRPWRAMINYSGKTHHIALTYTEREAALAYNLEAIKLFGEFACLNEINPENKC